jgi:hypothetical protein
MQLNPREHYDFPHSDHLSPSQINEYLACPLCFRLSRIDRVPKPLSVSLPIGGAVHKAVEAWRQTWYLGDARANPELEPADVIDQFVEVGAEHFDRSLEVDDETGGEVVLDLAGYGSVGEAKDHMVQLATYTLLEVSKLDSQRGLVAAELDLRDWPSPWPFRMAGRVDALYGPEPDVCNLAADLKTASKQSLPSFATALQLAIYRSIVPVPWYVDQVVKTQRPSMRTYVLSDDGDEFVRHLVLDVADRLCQGDFPARPGWFCAYSHGGPSFSVALDFTNPEEIG